MKIGDQVWLIGANGNVESAIVADVGYSHMTVKREGQNSLWTSQLNVFETRLQALQELEARIDKDRTLREQQLEELEKLHDSVCFQIQIERCANQSNNS